MNLIAVGTNHRYSPIELRERISFSKRRLGQALKLVNSMEGILGCVILSTCNRIELYASVKHKEKGFRQLKEFISRYHEVPLDKLEPCFYFFEGKGVVRHFCEVALGLDSQVLGETEILGQIRASYLEAKVAGVLDRPTEALLRKALKVGVMVRQITKISVGNVSIASVAFRLIKRNLGPLAGKRILLVGVGKMTLLLAKYLKREHAVSVFVSNRTHEKAEMLARLLRGEAIRFGRLKEKLQEADVVISATSSPHLILKKEDFTSLRHPVLVIDLALPRDIQPGAKEVAGVKLFDLDDLNLVIEENIEKRRAAARAAKKIIEKEIERTWLESYGWVPEPAPLL